jgi:mannose-6-phosphate isomerase-like protein (cupin superfamily)
MIKILKNSKLDNEKLKKCQLVNNDKLEGFDFSKAIVKKPWGHEYLAHNEGAVSAWILNINEGTATSMHCHLNKKTSLILLSGQAELSTLKDKFYLNEGDGFILDKKVFHSTKAILDGTVLMEIETPSIKTDLVRLHDNYGRESKGYELQNEMSFDLENHKRILFNDSKEKIVGNLCVSVKDFKSNDSFQDNINPSETILLLSGKIFDQRNNELFAAGDVFEINTPQEIHDIRIKEPVKILKIKKSKI